MPKRHTKDVIKAIFDPSDDPSAPPHQSVSEQQVGINWENFKIYDSTILSYC